MFGRDRPPARQLSNRPRDFHARTSAISAEAEAPRSKLQKELTRRCRSSALRQHSSSADHVLDAHYCDRRYLSPDPCLLQRNCRDDGRRRTQGTSGTRLSLHAAYGSIQNGTSSLTAAVTCNIPSPEFGRGVCRTHRIGDTAQGTLQNAFCRRCHR